MRVKNADEMFKNLGFAKVGEQDKTATYAKYGNGSGEAISIINVTVIHSGIIVNSYHITDPAKVYGVCVSTAVMEAALAKVDEFNLEEEVEA